MDSDTLLGVVIITGALGLILYLTLWSRRTINWIARNEHASTRHILKDINGRR